MGAGIPTAEETRRRTGTQYDLTVFEQFLERVRLNLAWGNETGTSIELYCGGYRPSDRLTIQEIRKVRGILESKGYQVKVLWGWLFFSRYSRMRISWKLDEEMVLQCPGPEAVPYEA